MRGVSDRNKKIDGMLKKIDELKSEIMLTFMRTQNLIISSYFDKAFEEHIMPAIHYGKSCILKEADYYYHLFADDEWEEFLEKLKED